MKVTHTISVNLPKFITFTGADDHTSIDGMLELSALYPIEWGILFSPKRQGIEPRYPSLSTINAIADSSPEIALAAHLCGGHSRDLLSKNETEFDWLIGDVGFKRVQVNTADPRVMEKTKVIGLWAKRLGATAIVQCRNENFFPVDANVEWLFDASGGRGVSPGEWPRPGSHGANSAFYGYAGGLGPDNVVHALQMIEWEADPNYCIDMESKVRDERDRFDLSRCRAVCEAVYGRRT